MSLVTNFEFIMMVIGQIIELLLYGIIGGFIISGLIIIVPKIIDWLHPKIQNWIINHYK